jgi:hypothetical protein
VFGGLRKSLNAANGDARAAAENVRDVQTIVCAEVARNYVELRAAEDQIAIVRATIDSEKDLLDLIRARADAGLSGCRRFTASAFCWASSRRRCWSNWKSSTRGCKFPWRRALCRAKY